MTLHHLEKRLRSLEGTNSAINRPDFSRIFPSDLRNWREILTLATEAGDWSTYYDDLAVHAPTVYAAYLKAAEQ